MARQLTRTRTAPVEAEPAEDEYDDEEEEETTTRRRSANGSRSHAKDDDEETHTSTRRTTGKRSASRTESSKARPGRSGWDGIKKNREKRQTGDDFRVKEDTSYLIHFLEPACMEDGAYLEHFIRELANNNERAAYACLEEDCPLDDIGDDPKDRALFNIVLIDEKGNARNMYWNATSSIIDIIEDFAKSTHNSPIDRTDLYFEVSKKKGKNKFFQYSLMPVKARDLADEGIEPLTDDELDELRDTMFDVSVLKMPSRKELRDIAEELDD